MSTKALPGRGFYGWDSTNETWVKILVDVNGKVQITSTDLTTVLSEIQNATYGLAALNTDLDTIIAYLSNATYGLAVLEALVDDVETILTNDVYGLAALNTDADSIISKVDVIDGYHDIPTADVTTNVVMRDVVGNKADAAVTTVAVTKTLVAYIKGILNEIESGTYGLSAIETLVDEAESLLKNGTYGLSALKALIDIAQADLDNPNQYKADVSAIALEATLTAIKGAGWTDENIKEIVDYLGNATYGLSALETLVDEIETLLKDGTNGLSAIKAEVEGLAGEAMRGTNNAALASSLTTHDTDIKADIGDFSGQTNLQSLLAALGIPDVSAKSLYTCLITDRLDHATNGLAAIKAEVEGIGGITPATQANVSTEVDQQIGNFAGQTYLATLLAALGIPDVTGKPLYTCLITDRLDNATFGISAIKTLIDATNAYVDEIESILKDGTYGLSALDTDLGTLLTRLSSDRAGYLDNLNNAQLLNISATILGRIDAAISSRSSHAAADVWSVVTRALTDKANFTLAAAEYDNIRKSVCLTGDTASSIGKILYDFYITRLTATRTGYIDNLSAGAAALEATLTAVKGNGWTAETIHAIYDLIDAILDLTRTGDSLTADGNEQNVYINNAPASLFKPLHIHIDTTAMAADDATTIKIYYRIKTGGELILASTNAYSDAQAVPLKLFDLKPNLFGIKVTLEQTAGTNRIYDWECYYGA